MAEHTSSDQRVGGSNPSGRTYKSLQIAGFPGDVGKDADVASVVSPPDSPPVGPMTRRRPHFNIRQRQTADGRPYYSVRWRENGVQREKSAFETRDDAQRYGEWVLGATQTGRPTPSSYVYAIQAGDSGPIKIGTTTNPEARLTEFQIGHHEELRLLAYGQGGRVRERDLHERLADYQIRGEWFYPVPAVMAAVHEIASEQAA